MDASRSTWANCQRDLARPYDIRSVSAQGPAIQETTESVVEMLKRVG
jgi:hypothetical protein